MNIKELIKKYQDIILYIFFGVCTTAVNVASYWVMAHIVKTNTLISSILAWFIAVVFAYLTNRKWVFHSENDEKTEIIKEFISFLVCRLATGVVDWGIMWIFVDKLKLNDLIIKILSNILVIILNYVASKLIIFSNKKDKKIKKKVIVDCIVLTFFACATFIFLLKSPLHIWNDGNISTDSSVFKTIGLMISKGYTPYLDTFDHKGPLIYLINWIGIQISYYKGVWIIEFLSLFITFCALYKISKIKSNISWSIMTTFLSISLLFIFFQGGNLTEEYAMPFIAVSLYIFLDYFINKKVNKKRLIMCGLCLAGVLLLRPNMISVWIVFCLAIFIKCLKEKQYKELINFIIYFLIGLGILIIPVVIWLVSKGALIDFWKDYIEFNKTYTLSFENNSVFGFQLEAFIHFFENSIIIFATIITLYLWKVKKDSIYGIYAGYIIVTLLLTSMSGRIYNHYGMVLVPIIAFPFSSLYELCRLEKKGNNIVELLAITYIIGILILPNWMELLQTVPKAYAEKDKSKISENVQQISKIVKSKTNENDKISVYGNWNIIYVQSKRLPATKYSFQFPIGEVEPSIMNSYISQLGQELPKIIVVQKGKYNETIKTFLEKNNYNLIWKENEDLSKTAQVFELKTAL